MEVGVNKMKNFTIPVWAGILLVGYFAYDYYRAKKHFDDIKKFKSVTDQPIYGGVLPPPPPQTSQYPAYGWWQ